MAMLKSFDLQGNKNSFSDWISNISPEDTFLVSNSTKESTPTNRYKWQTDALDQVVYDLSQSLDDFAIEEGSEAPATETIKTKSTAEYSGVTQIFRKTFTISDSALATAAHGREKELKYQLEKSGKELKNVMEIVFSSKQVKTAPDATHTTAKTDGLFSLIAAKDLDNPDLKAPATAGENAVHKAGELKFASIDAIASALYRSGSKASYIVTNPVNANAINKARDEAETAKVKQLSIVDKSNSAKETELNTITDSMGKTWIIFYSRFVPADLVYFVDPDAIKQRVLREPKAVQLGKSGSFETWQLIIESGLCLTNPFACGLLEITSTNP
ncbi:SU10 major capsid protein [Enterobacter hormaechei]|uniref:SU10 major capsid protein n=1 Tax=Enterobacter hormaechei TaxID=158836 RepID=UPI0013D268F9|nr:DUF5309 family protein [Enterobacter hormaechei]